MYKVYGTSIFVPGLDLGTSGLEPNTGTVEPRYKEVGYNKTLL